MLQLSSRSWHLDFLSLPDQGSVNRFSMTNTEQPGAAVGQSCLNTSQPKPGSKLLKVRDCGLVSWVADTVSERNELILGHLDPWLP